jgi:hypothetical protein
MQIDILNGLGVDPVIDAISIPESTTSILDNANVTQLTNINDTTTVSSTVQHEQQMRQMKGIALEMMGYFTIGAFCTAIHSAMFDSVGQVSYVHVIMTHRF